MTRFGIIVAAIVLGYVPASADEQGTSMPDMYMNNGMICFSRHAMNPAAENGCGVTGCGVTGSAMPIGGTFSWRLATRTYGGRITITNNLTKEQCEIELHHANGEPADGEEAAIRQYFDAKDKADCDGANAISCTGASAITTETIRDAECLTMQ
jgi:hypothetical protein